MCASFTDRILMLERSDLCEVTVEWSSNTETRTYCREENFFLLTCRNMLLHSALPGTERCGRVVNTSFVFGRSCSGLGLKTGDRDCRFSWICSVPPAECRHSTSVYATTAVLRILYDALFTSLLPTLYSLGSWQRRLQ